METPSLPILYLSIADFARRLGVAKNTVVNWTKQGLPTVRIGRVVRVPVTEATAWLLDQGKPQPSRSPERIATPASEQTARVRRQERVPTFSTQREREPNSQSSMSLHVDLTKEA